MVGHGDSGKTWLLAFRDHYYLIILLFIILKQSSFFFIYLPQAFIASHFFQKHNWLAHEKKLVKDELRTNGEMSTEYNSAMNKNAAKFSLKCRLLLIFLTWPFHFIRLFLDTYCIEFCVPICIP